MSGLYQNDKTKVDKLQLESAALISNAINRSLSNNLEKITEEKCVTCGYSHVHKNKARFIGVKTSEIEIKNAFFHFRDHISHPNVKIFVLLPSNKSL